MKNYKKTAAICCLLAVIITAACRTHFDTTLASYTVTHSSAAFERGKVLTYSICGQCHFDKGTRKLIGMQMKDVPGIIGKVYSANITRSKSHGVTVHYTDAELRYLLKRGITRDGRFSEYMLRPNMADADIDAIIVYLRSDDPAVSPGDTTIGLTHLNFIGKAVMGMKAKPAAFRSDVKLPSESDLAGLGRYLVDNVACYHCHSKSFNSLNYEHPELSKNYMGGGIKFKNKEGVAIYASNLTPDKQTGIGNLSKSDFRKAVKDGIGPQGNLHEPMPKFKLLSDKEVDAIYTYLRTIPAKENKVGE